MSTLQKTILYIDDDQDDRLLLREQLSSADATITIAEAENGLQGIDYLSQASTDNTLPCLIVLDLNMPVMDGKETFLKIHRDNQLRGIPLIIYTSSADPNDRAYFRQYGVKVFTKPSTSLGMKDVVQHMLKECMQ